MCGVSRQGAWPTPGSRSQNHMLSPDARHWGHGIGSSEAGSSKGSTLSPAPLGRLFYGLTPVSLLQKCNPNLLHGAISQPLFLHKYQVRLSPLLHLPIPSFLVHSCGAYGRVALPFSVFIPETPHEKSCRQQCSRIHSGTTDAPVDTPALCHICDLIHVMSRLRQQAGTHTPPRCIRSLLPLWRSYLHRRP